MTSSLIVRSGTAHHTIRLPGCIQSDIICFLLVPIQRFLNIYLQEDDQSLEYLDLELPKLNITCIEKIWRQGNAVDVKSRSPQTQMERMLSR